MIPTRFVYKILFSRTLLGFAVLAPMRAFVASGSNKMLEFIDGQVTGEEGVVCIDASTLVTESWVE